MNLLSTTYFVYLLSFNEELEVKSINIFKLFIRTPQWIKDFENSNNIYILLFVLFARVIGFKCQFVASFYPIPLSFSKKKTMTNEGKLFYINT